MSQVDLMCRMPGGFFNYRVGAVIIHNGRFLLMRNPGESYAYTVGGRVRFGETTEEAVVREVKEETNVTLEIDRMLFFQEQLFVENGLRIHEIGVYFLMKDSEALENVECHSHAKSGAPETLFWAAPEELDKLYIVPESVAAKLRDLPMLQEHIIEINDRW